MKRTFRRILTYSFAGLIVVVLGLGAIGGGWGDKPPLPDTIAGAPRPLLLAHRGAVGRYPENSLGAVGEAVRLGFPGIEIDLQYSADSIFFLMHDSETARTLGIPGVAANMTLVELQEHGLVAGGAATGERVPGLDEVIDRTGAGTIFYLDMKRHGHRSKLQLARDIAAFIDDRGLYDRVMVASAHVPFITWLEYNYPRIVTVLEGIDPERPWLQSLLPRRFRTDLIASRWATATPDFIEWLNGTGMNERYVTYHIEPGRVESAAAAGLQLFIVDYDPVLQELLGNHGTN